MEESKLGFEPRTIMLGKYTQTSSIDQPGSGGARHRYIIETVSPHPLLGVIENVRLGEIKFQEGPIKEAGINGVQNEDLLAIVIDRLKSFQAGPFACDQNEAALTLISAGFEELRNRTVEREKRGVEGEHKV